MKKIITLTIVFMTTLSGCSEANGSPSETPKVKETPEVTNGLPEVDPVSGLPIEKQEKLEEAEKPTEDVDTVWGQPFVENSEEGYSIEVQEHTKEDTKEKTQEHKENEEAPKVTVKPTPTTLPTTLPTTPTVDPTPTANPTPIPTPVATPTATPVQTSTPAPTPTPTPTATPTPSVTSVKNSAEITEMVNCINADRNAVGLSSLSVSSTLTDGAAIRAVEITELFSHTRPDGSDWSTVNDSVYGENIAYATADGTNTHSLFMASEGHKANILGEDWNTVGIATAVSGNNTYWAVHFGY